MAALVVVSSAAYAFDDARAQNLVLDVNLVDRGAAGIGAEHPSKIADEPAVELRIERNAPVFASAGAVRLPCMANCGNFAETDRAPGMATVASDRVIEPFSGLAATDAVADTEVRAGSPPSVFKVSPNWRLGPLRWSGTLGNTFAWAGSSGQSMLNMTQSTAVSVNTFVWQPWFLLVGGTASLNQSSTTNTTTTPGTEEVSSSSVVSRTKGLGVTGGVTLDFLPQSRFPFSATFNTQQSRTTAVERTTTGGYNLSLRGQYAPLIGKDKYSGGYSRNSASLDGRAIGATDQIFGEYSNYFPALFQGTHQVTAAGSWTRSTMSDHSNDNTFFRLHGNAVSDYYDDYGIKLFSDVDYYNNENLGVSGGAGRVSVFQVSSSGSWVPEDDIPVTVNGSVAFSSFQAEGQGVAASSQTGTASVNASYRYSPQISLGAGLSAQWSEDGLSVSGNGNVSAGYSGQPRQLGEFIYQWSANGGASAATTGGLGFSSGVNHQISRTIVVGTGGQLRLSASQGVSMSHSGTVGSSGSLTSTATLAYSFVPMAGSSASFSLSGSDSRAFGTYGTSFQTLAMLASGSAKLSRFSSLTANISANLSRTGASKTAGTDGAGVTDGSGAETSWTASGSGVVSYQHGRAFGISRLSYNASYLLTPSGWGSSNLNELPIPGGLIDPNGLSSPKPRNIWSHAFTQAIGYRLGRISVNLTNAFSVSGERKNASIMLSVVREIGNY